MKKKCPFCFPNVPKFLPAMRHLSQTFFNLAGTLVGSEKSKTCSMGKSYSALYSLGSFSESCQVIARHLVL